MKAKVAILAAFGLVLALPFLVRALSTRPDATVSPAGADRTLIIVTPHVEQIRFEFGIAFSEWHARRFGDPAGIDWRQPGGTSEIIKQLEAQFDAAARNGRIDSEGRCEPGAAGYDVFFGGGSYEHGKLKARRAFAGPAGKIEYRIAQPAGFESTRLDEWFGDNRIGVQELYDPEQCWIGTALSGFGIVFNRDVLARRGMPEPRSFTDLCDSRYQNLLALADPRQSGSITTTFESIMNKEGWDRGWQTLREMSANARYFASAATKVPVDVSQGDAAAGLAIDFYGRGQAQFTMATGESASEARVGYVDPEGAVYIDADPVTILNGARDFELAKRFVEFCLTEEAQALWQFHTVDSSAGSDNPPGPSGRPMGPVRYELRRMPVRRVMYAKYQQHMIDQANPFELASNVPRRGWRDAIAPLMSAFGVDVSHELREAWKVLNDARARGVAPDVLARMESAFYAMPRHQTQPHTLVWPPEILAGLDKDARRELSRRRISTFPALERELASPAAANLNPKTLELWREVAAKRSQFGRAEPWELPFDSVHFPAILLDADAWRDTEHAKRSTIRYADFFRSQYRDVVKQSREALHG